MKLISFLNQKKIEHYSSVEDLPMYNWNKIHETNDLKWLQKDTKIIATKKQLQQLQESWDEIFNEFILKFGIPETLLKITELKKEIAVRRARLLLGDSPTEKVFLNIAILELKKLLSNEEKEFSFNDLNVYVQRFMGFPIKENEVTVSIYYSYLNALKNQQSFNKKQNG